MRSRSFAKDRPLSAFGRYLVSLCEVKQIKVFSLTPAVGNKTRLSFALRGRPSKGSRGALLEIGELEAIARILRASRHEARRIVLLGLLEHGPPELKSCVIGMAEDVVDFASRLNARLPNLDLSGTERPLPEKF